FNLGMVSLLVLQLLCIGFFAKTEPVYFVWIYNSSPAGFIWRKMKDGLAGIFLLSFPVITGMGIFFFEHLLLLICIPAVGFLYLVLILLAKYAGFPRPMSILQTLFIAFCFSFPPAVLFFIPFFY